jgi:hypothetical protein|tara:strand:+ start:739 stop:903 length:165 start_codon:yes stop_codon:yes gene_type:complete
LYVLTNQAFAYALGYTLNLRLASALTREYNAGFFGFGLPELFFLVLTAITYPNV